MSGGELDRRPAPGNRGDPRSIPMGRRGRDRRRHRNPPRRGWVVRVAWTPEAARRPPQRAAATCRSFSSIGNVPMSALAQLADLVQSIWYDNVRSAPLDSGELADDLDRYTVTGVTSNLTILENAIAGGSGDDEGLLHALGEGGRGSGGAVLVAREPPHPGHRGPAGRRPRAGQRTRWFRLPRTAPTARGRHARVGRVRRRARPAVGRPNLMVEVPGTPPASPPSRS
jgi:hypothetical protein